MRKHFEATISGRVQGVMYRDFVRRNSNRLGITGTVENVSDGTVRVVAEGEEKTLIALVAILKSGPMFARVDDVVVRWGEVTDNLKDFRIVYHGLFDRL